ncbi:hypothetical protein N7474_005644 [Penicillium riverlandense]|uniref:uncharacterized protein n=1 Tax=Penicillium riverlandense TaxID=1903569 RepID=UPI00254806C7|nr:uncharacterized protein N7474_005644 [Penicillium riverlandense]KAJ5820053.1 hypothetical protein N7474_005644 [Penicillium riverlandense]
MISDIPLWLPSLDPIGVFIIALSPILLFFLTAPKRQHFPLLNGREWFELSYTHAKQRYLSDARNIIRSGLKEASVFRVISDNGPKTILAPKYATDIRSHPSLSFGASISKEFHSNIRGFEPFQQGTRSDELFQTAGVLRSPYPMRHPLHSRKNGQQILPSILKIVAQLSSKVFLGDQICRNPDWLRITISYTVDSFVAARALRQWPEFMRPLVANFLPCCHKIRRELEEARSIINPVLEERRQAKKEAVRTGKPLNRFNDAMQWMEEVAKGRSYDAAVAQISFSLAAIHTTTDMLTQVLLDMCGKEEIIQALREEVVSVIQKEGWKKTTLYKLKLMDSVLKESQRLKPIGIGDIKLSDGTLLRKGTFLLVSGEKMWDPQVYSSPDTFDPYRFLKLRETPGHETSAQLVSPSPEHLGFGYGNHACPGRFFAVNEVKIALCHILLKYDFKLAPGSARPTVKKTGVSWNADPTASIAIRRRQEEITL